MRRAIALVTAFGVAAAVILFIAGPLGTPACAAELGVRLDLRVLLVSTTGDDESIVAWRDLLVDEGVPFDEIHLADHEVLRGGLLRAPDGHGRYQAIVLADSHLSVDGRPDVPSLLDDTARAAIATYQRSTGARVVAASIVPDAALPVVVPRSPQDLDGLTGQLTAEGRAVFPYLRGPVPIEGAFGFLPSAPVPASITTLAALPDGTPLVFVDTGAGGIETLYVAPQVSTAVLHWRLLRHGLLGWATGGVHLGLRRLHFAMQVDDVFLPNFRWDLGRNQTRQEAGEAKMTPADVRFAADWIRDHDLRIDMAFNAAGRTKDMCSAVLAERDVFGWVSHTYAHRDLDDLPKIGIVEEITRNRRWAEEQHLPGLDGRALVTGAHTGLQNPAMPSALEEAGIRWVAADASIEPEQRQLGAARTVPRHPTDIYYDASTRAEQLDEYNHVYVEACDPDAARCRTSPATWDDFVAVQADIMFRHVIDGDPRVHYAHQSNLTDDRTLLAPLEAMLERYASYIDAELLQPTLVESGQELARQQAWAHAVSDSDVDAWTDGRTVHVTTSVDVDVPLTGVAGLDYAGEPTAWVHARAGQELVYVLQ